MKKITTIFLLLFVITSLSDITAQYVNSDIGKADELVRVNKFDKAELLYKKAQEDEGIKNLATYKLAVMYHSIKKYNKAVDEYLKIASGGNATVLYNLSCALSMLGDAEKALDYLEQAVDKGFNQLSVIKSDTDLDNIRQYERFKKIIKSIKTLENFPEAEKFDFWVGEWNVYNPQGQKVGESKIEKILKNAVILENWYGGTGYVGKSFNHFHMDKQKWIQYWVDQNSNPVYFEGNWNEDENALVYFSYDHAEDENPYIRQLTFFNLAPDTVRQFSQRSTDNGETWNTEYDFTYISKSSDVE